MSNPQDYKQTLQMPQTSFDMRADLPKKEPGFIEHWKKIDLYGNMLRHNEGKPTYILHDGPPYANGDIHMGTALNKVLKDIVVKYKSMAGFQAPYVPGWDTHGLPTELKALKKLGVDKNGVPVDVLRKHCREFALSYVESLRDQVYDFFQKRIPKIVMLKPEATFVCWLDCRGLGMEHEEMMKFFTQVGTLMGNGLEYDAELGRGHVRMAYAFPRAQLMEALEKLASAVEKL